MSSPLLDMFRGTGKNENPLTPSRTTGLGRAEKHRALPSTESGWKARYMWLADWYAGEPYADDDVKALRLFKAVDADDEVIAMAQRLTRDFQFVIDTDTHALAGGRWSLQMAGGVVAQEQLEAGEAVWRRSGLQAHKAGWIRSMANLGDLWVESVRMDDDTVQLVAYDARHCTPEYSADGQTLERLTIQIRYFGAPDADGTRALHVYTRTLTPDRIEATEDDRDGVPVTVVGQSGEHKLGVVPAVHLRMTEIVGCPEHSLGAGHGLDLPMGAMDSAMAQVRAVFERYAHPKLVVTGARMGTNNFEQFGRYIDALPEGADMSYLEPTMAGLQPMWEVIRGYMADVRSTIPEFTLAGAGANTSGRALEFRADQFRRKMLDAQTRTHAEIAKVTHYAVLMGEGLAYDGADRGYRIVAPPPLPIDGTGRAQIVVTAVEGGLLKRVDGVKQMQALGILDEEIDAEAYAAELEAERAARAPDFTAGGGDPDADDDPDDDSEPDAPTD